jgi:hypothetical protein
MKSFPGREFLEGTQDINFLTRDGFLMFQVQRSNWGCSRLGWSTELLIQLFDMQSKEQK